MNPINPVGQQNANFNDPKMNTRGKEQVKDDTILLPKVNDPTLPQFTVNPAVLTPTPKEFRGQDDRGDLVRPLSTDTTTPVKLTTDSDRPFSSETFKESLSEKAEEIKKDINLGKEKMELKAEETSEAAKETAAGAAGAVQSIGEAAKENLVWASEKIQEKAPELWEKAKENAEWATEKIQEKAPEAWEKAKENAEWAKEKVTENAEWAKEKVTENAEWAKEKVTEKAKGDLPWIWEGIKENAAWAGQKAKETLTSVKDTAVSILPAGMVPEEKKEITTFGDLSTPTTTITPGVTNPIPSSRTPLDIPISPIETGIKPTPLPTNTTQFRKENFDMDTKSDARKY